MQGRERSYASQDWCSLPEKVMQAAERLRGVQIDNRSAAELMLDELRADDIQYQAYYRKKFMKMADRLEAQICYDYDEAVEKCRKKQQKKESGSDIGDDGLTQLIRRDFKVSKKIEKGAEAGGK